MQNFNYDIIRKNTDILIKNSNMTQTDLARILGMSQSNVSKALSARDKKYFTLEQLYTIAEYFNVSMDWLTGREVSNEIDTSEKNIAGFMAALLSKRIIKTGLPSNVETVYGPNPNEGGTPAYTPRDENIPKECFYFPNQLRLSDYNGKEYEQALKQFETEGNDAPGKVINGFMNKYLKVLKLYLSKELDEEVHQLALDKFLGDI